VIREYKRFTFLATAAGHSVAPSKAVDEAWHLHMIYTESYWIRYCAEVLRMPLHHYPSTGNRKEHDKFGQWYAQTLESYRRLFAEEPPSDIWPAPNTPQRESHSVRIDRGQHWVIRKPNWTRLTAAQVFPSLKAGWLWLLLGGLIFSGLGCAHNFSGFSSPLDWKGPDFLRFFVISWLVSLAIAIPLRRALRSPGPDEKESLPELDPYEVAYLRGGAKLAVDAGIASLVNNGILKLHETERRLMPVKALAEGAPPIEQAVYESASSEPNVAFKDVRAFAKPAVERIKARLEELKLTVSDDNVLQARWLPFLVAVLVPLAGLCKIYIGVMRGKPITLLVMLSIAATLVAVFGFGRRPHRTRRGDALFAQMKQKHAGLETSAHLSSPDLAAAALPLAIGLFGLGILADTGHSELRKRLGPEVAVDSSCGSSCGSGCGGGGCGGGCGGCGGGD